MSALFRACVFVCSVVFLGASAYKCACARPPSQVERKRKCGNDIGVLVFKEGGTPFDADASASRVNQVICVLNADQVCEFDVTLVVCPSALPGHPRR